MDEREENGKAYAGQPIAAEMGFTHGCSDVFFEGSSEEPEDVASRALHG